MFNLIRIIAVVAVVVVINIGSKSFFNSATSSSEAFSGVTASIKDTIQSWREKAVAAREAAVLRKQEAAQTTWQNPAVASSRQVVSSSPIRSIKECSGQRYEAAGVASTVQVMYPDAKSF